MILVFVETQLSHRGMILEAVVCGAAALCVSIIYYFIHPSYISLGQTHFQRWFETLSSPRR